MTQKGINFCSPCTHVCIFFWSFIDFEFDDLATRSACGSECPHVCHPTCLHVFPALTIATIRLHWGGPCNGHGKPPATRALMKLNLCAERWKGGHTGGRTGGNGWSPGRGYRGNSRAICYDTVLSLNGSEEPGGQWTEPLQERQLIGVRSGPVFLQESSTGVFGVRVQAPEELICPAFA